jgi:hypothetical protein
MAGLGDLFGMKADQPPTDPAGTAAKPDPSPQKKRRDPKHVQTGEIGGPSGPEPTRYGDWERGGRCVDF